MPPIDSTSCALSLIALDSANYPRQETALVHLKKLN